jgi:hypothetical protein
VLNPYERSDIRVISCLSISCVILYDNAIYICDSVFMSVSKLPTLPGTVLCIYVRVRRGILTEQALVSSTSFCEEMMPYIL